MSVSTYTDVWCDVCGTWEENATSTTGREARRKASSCGWKVGMRGGLDVCPECAAAGKTPTGRLGSS